MPLNPILRTKLFIPHFRSEYVSRPHLVDLINKGIKNKLVFIFAPAGYGKSTLIVEWTKQTSLPIAWLSLDHTDRDPVTFYQYLIASIQNIFPKLGDNVLLTLSSISLTPPTKTVVTALINEILEHADEFTLVLDDFHCLANPDVIQILDALIDDLPPQMHVIIASRSDLPFPYTRMLTRGEMTAIGIDELCFKPHEVTLYLRSQLGNQLNPAEEEILRDRSEGWIAGLYLAVLSLQTSHNLHEDVVFFSGQNRYVSDYLIDEVLSRQNPDIYQFLVQTSVLNKFTAEICNHTTGRDNSQAILDYLDRSGLFVVPLDNNRTWYRYHQLFDEFLNNRLKEQQPEIVARLHRKAAEWFTNHHLIDEAVEHWLAAEDYDIVVEFIHDWLDEIMASGKFTTFLNWLDCIPNNFLINKPKLILYQLFQLWEMGCLEKYHQQLQVVKKMMGPTPMDSAGLDPEIAGYHGILAIIRCVSYAADYNITKISQYLDRLFLLIPEEWFFWRVMANGAAGFCNRVKGNYVEANKYFSQAISLSSSSGQFFPFFMYTTAKAVVLLATGQLTAAIESCKLSLSLEAQQKFSIPFSGLAHALMGELLYLCSDLSQAKENIWRGIELITNDGEVYSTSSAFFTLAQILIAQGDPDGAVNTMDIMMQRLHDMKAPLPAVIIAEAYQAEIWIRCDRLEPALSWHYNTRADQLNRSEYPHVMGACYFGIYCTVHESFEVYYQLIQMTIARIELANGNARTALDRVNLVLSQIDKEKMIFFTAKVYILKALVLLCIDTPDQEETILDAVRLVMNEPCYRLFICEGKPMRDLLKMTKAELLANTSLSLAESRPLLKFIEEVLERMDAEDSSLNARQGSEIDFYGLTPRETIVLEHLSHGVSYDEIAHILTMSPNTVKTHINHIYKKMGVSNRLQAVNKARESGQII